MFQFDRHGFLLPEYLIVAIHNFDNFTAKTQRSQRMDIFSFAAERSSNENHQPLRGTCSAASGVFRINNSSHSFNNPKGSCISLFVLSTKREMNLNTSAFFAPLAKRAVRFNNINDAICFLHPVISIKNYRLKRNLDLNR